MKCCSRSTLGVVVGILNVVSCIGLTILAAVLISNLDAIKSDNYLERNDIARTKTIYGFLIVICLVMAIISGLFIVGIVKRLHKLMMPWLILSGIGLVIHCGRFVFVFFGAVFSGADFSTCLIILAVGIIGIGISALILWPLFMLFGDIRQNNIKEPRRVLVGAEMAYKSSENY